MVKPDKKALFHDGGWLFGYLPSFFVLFLNKNFKNKGFSLAVLNNNRIFARQKISDLLFII